MPNSAFLSICSSHYFFIWTHREQWTLVNICANTLLHASAVLFLGCTVDPKIAQAGRTANRVPAWHRPVFIHFTYIHWELYHLLIADPIITLYSLEGKSNTEPPLMSYCRPLMELSDWLVAVVPVPLSATLHPSYVQSHKYDCQTPIINHTFTYSKRFTILSSKHAERYL